MEEIIGSLFLIRMKRGRNFKRMYMRFYAGVRDHGGREDIYKTFLQEKVPYSLDESEFFFEKLMHFVTSLLEVISMLLVPKVQQTEDKLAF